MQYTSFCLSRTGRGGAKETRIRYSLSCCREGSTDGVLTRDGRRRMIAA